jgi:alkylation response protein AidB-like acyl-CoA dehydrogenase
MRAAFEYALEFARREKRLGTGCMRLVGIVSYTRDLAPLEKIMRDAMVFPLYDGGNQGVRRRQLHQMFMRPEYNSMLAARGEVPAWEQLELTGAGM